MATDPDAEDDDQWRFSLDDLEDEESTEGEGNVAGSLATEEDIEAGDVGLENAVFVVVGVLLAMLVLAGFVVFF